MYDRRLRGEVLSFGHEGLLYRNSFVMYDRGTRSLWVHTTGQAVKGERRGDELTFLPSEVLPWSAWVEAHPRTLVLDRGGQDHGFMSRFGLPDETDEYGLSVGDGLAPKLYPYELLVDLGLINDGKLLVLHDEASQTARAFLRGGHRFTWKKGALLDERGVSWNAVSGASSRAGEARLQRVPATAWLIERWEGFYPDAEVYER